MLPPIEKEHVGQDACTLTTHGNGLATIRIFFEQIKNTGSNIATK
jgi:hypothetical protein